jgi:tellurite resistance protein
MQVTQSQIFLQALQQLLLRLLPRPQLTAVAVLAAVAGTVHEAAAVVAVAVLVAAAGLVVEAVEAAAAEAITVLSMDLWLLIQDCTQAAAGAGEGTAAETGVA